METYTRFWMLGNEPAEDAGFPEMERTEGYEDPGTGPETVIPRFLR